MTGRSALITGITGQDGSYLAQFLLEKGYQVHGLVRRSSSANTGRIDGIGSGSQANGGDLKLHSGDLSDAGSILRVIKAAEPDEIYNLAAQSHVHESFACPEYTADCTGAGVLRILEAVRSLGIGESARFYQASTSELYGAVSESPQSETTPFAPRSPYAVAKLYGYWITVTYREGYGFHASNGIMFNHESPRRGATFVTRKITRGVAAIVQGWAEELALGNLDSRRDWGHARDYVEGMWLALQHKMPGDYVFATGETRTVREFVERAFACAGIGIAWEGEGLAETGIDRASGKVRVRVDPQYFRPTDVGHLIGDASKARAVLGWAPKTSFDDLVAEMVAADLATAEPVSEAVLV